MRLTWSLCVALTQLAVARAVTTTPSPSLPACRSTNRVPPSCDFLTVCNYTSYHEGSTNISWVLANGTVRPILTPWRPPGSTDQSYYVYLDAKHEVPVGSKAMMSAEISHDVTAICVEFHYATNGLGKQNIRVLLQSTPGYGPSYRTDPVVFELKNFTTTYAWKMATFSTCLNGSRHISFESSTISGPETVSIDGIKVTAADLQCGTTTTVVTTSTTEVQPFGTDPATDSPSCDFQTLCNYGSYNGDNTNLTWVLADGPMRPIISGWGTPGATDASSYVYMDVYTGAPVTSQSLLSTHISQDLTAIHVEFRYATSGFHPHDIRVLLQSTPGYGPSYSTDRLVFELTDINTAFAWRYASFSACLNGKYFISFESTKTSGLETVALDSIQITSTGIDCS